MSDVDEKIVQAEQRIGEKIAQFEQRITEKISQAEHRTGLKHDKVMDEIFKLSEKVAEVLALSSGLASDVKNNEKNLDEFKKSARGHHASLFSENSELEKRLRAVETKPKNTSKAEKSEKSGTDSVTTFKVKVIWGLIIATVNAAITAGIAWVVVKATGGTP